MRKHIFIPLTLLAVLLAACENEIDYRGEEQDPLLVLNCIAEAGGQTFVSVSHSQFFLGADTQQDVTLREAVVTIDINGRAETVTYDAEVGGYLDSRILAEGDQLTITATHSRYGTVSAADVVPHTHGMSCITSTLPYAAAASASITEEAPGALTEYARTDSILRVSLHIDDPEGEDNFYRLHIYACGDGHITSYDENGPWFISTNITSEEPDDTGLFPCEHAVYYALPSGTQFTLGVEDEDLSELGIGMSLGSLYLIGEESFIFTDEYLHSAGTASDIVFDVFMQTPTSWGDPEGWLNAEAHTVMEEYFDGESHMVDYGTPWDHLDNHFIYTVTVSLETITPAYYYYLKSSDKYESSNWTLFSEPVTVYSNIDGGVGILGISSTSTVLTLQREYTFPLPQKK